jgi:hypothetical protein
MLNVEAVAKPTLFSVMLNLSLHAITVKTFLKLVVG